MVTPMDKSTVNVGVPRVLLPMSIMSHYLNRQVFTILSVSNGKFIWSSANVNNYELRVTK